ncbi:MAG: hypothetical protein O7E51_07585 [Acidobacteria bacterium]|nr:hypothetical protein [Acidobacteriota bacterium]
MDPMKKLGTTRLAVLCMALLFLTGPVAALAQQPPAQPDRPRGALFSEQGPSNQPLSPAWLICGVYVLAGLIFAGACAQGAVHKALSPIPWFFLGFFLNAAGYLILLTRAPGDAGQFPAGIPRGLRKVPRTYYSEECPGCGYPNHPAAHYCPGCGALITPPFESEAARWRKQRSIQ